MDSPENPADVVLSAEAESRVEFSDLSERMALKLGALVRYVARAHFMTWEKLRDLPDFDSLEGIFTPLVGMEMAATDIRVTPGELLVARGSSIFGKVLDAEGRVRNIARDGVHALFRADGEKVGEVRFINVFTRYDKDPVKRKVLEIPAELGVGSMPSRVTEPPTVESLLPLDRDPDLPAAEPGVWYYAQTDPNQHVNSLAYLQVMQDFVATRLHREGVSMADLWASRARIVFRKPCFRGEEYRRFAWRTGDSPLVIGGAIAKAEDPAGHLPAAAVELTLQRHLPRDS